ADDACAVRAGPRTLPRWRRAAHTRVTPTHCPRCATELPPDALACPACKSLLHADRLKQLAGDAERATQANDRVSARDRWSEALRLLPPHSQQHTVIRDRVA